MRKQLFIFIGLLVLFGFALFLSLTPEQLSVVPSNRTISSSTIAGDPIAITHPPTHLPTEPPPPRSHSIVSSEPKKSGEVKQVVSQPPPEPPPPPPPTTPKLPESLIYQMGMERTVNLVCFVGNNKYVFATGAIVSPNGYIISNAHVAVSINSTDTCSVRRNSPATTFAEARLLFAPNDYSTATSSESEADNDFAIWKIVNPGTYPYWEIDFQKRFYPDEVLLTQSYPAELLGNVSAFSSLALVFSTTSITATDTIIVRSTANIAGQKGSSGGILIDPYTAKIRSLLFGVGKEEDISKRDLYSLSPYGINKIMKKETGKTLEEYLAGNP